MIKIYDIKEVGLSAVLNRELESYVDYESAVKEILTNVKLNGDAALFYYAQKFDGVTLDRLEVSEEEIKEAFSSVEQGFVKVMEQAAENIAYFHRNQLREGFRLCREDGVILGQKYTPIAKAGIYVPGGTASYPSTVLMNAVPAKIAGVSEIIMVTPPMKNGKVKAEILVAARLAGVNRIFKCGGAGAIGALAYGTQSVPKADKIVGPGNIYVALAKKEVFGVVGIDMVAGPSEILIIADSGASARCVAADMLSQAEHDILASAVLITDDKVLARAVQAEIEIRIQTLPRKDIARASVDNNGKIIVTEDLKTAVEIANVIAPEHLELCVRNPFDWLDKVINAGSIFLGTDTPEALGDYYAGPNHTLPTSGSARFSSPLSVDDFVKKSSYIYYTAQALEKASAAVMEFAAREGLDAHAESVKARLK